MMPVLFTQDGCADSANVRAWLDRCGVAFTERNVTGDGDAAAALIATGLVVTPLLVIGETRIVGFRQALLAEHFPDCDQSP